MSILIYRDPMRKAVLYMFKNSQIRFDILGQQN